MSINLTHHKYQEVSAASMKHCCIHSFTSGQYGNYERERLKLLRGPPALLLALFPEVLSMVGISSHLRQPPHVFGKSEAPLLRPPLECNKS